MSEQIKIDNGIKTYDIVDKNGKVFCQIKFNPSDTDFVKRYEEVKRRLSLLKNDFGKNTEKKSISDQLNELDAIVYEQIDYLLNAKVSESIFSIMGPFSPLSSGEFFFENVLNAISIIIKKEADKNTAKVEKRINKYTRKYYK